MAAETALLLLDLQRDFLETNGRLPVGANNAMEVLTHSARLIASAKAGGPQVIFVVNEFLPDDRIGNYFRNHSAIRGSSGAEIDPRIADPVFPVFSKHASDAFSNSALLAHLRARNVVRLGIAGVFAEGCVRATAKGALKHGFAVTILEDAIASDSAWKKRFVLWSMRRGGIRVQRCAGFLGATAEPATGN